MSSSDYVTVNKNGFTFKIKPKKDQITQPPSMESTKQRVEKRKSIRKSIRQQRNDYPHPKIHPRDYYTLIDDQQSDPARLRQLLLWCCQASKPAKPSELDPLSIFILKLVQVIKEKLMDALRSKSLSTSWYHRPVTCIHSRQATKKLPQSILVTLKMKSKSLLLTPNYKGDSI